MVTRHANKRIHQRMGIKKKGIERVAKNALENGITHKEAKGQLLKYMNKVYSQHYCGNNMRIFAEKVFVFENDTLITVFSLPRQYIAAYEKIMRKKNKLD